jgi:hypothetical protein
MVPVKQGDPGSKPWPVIIVPKTKPITYSVYSDIVTSATAVGVLTPLALANQPSTGGDSIPNGSLIRVQEMFVSASGGTGGNYRLTVQHCGLVTAGANVIPAPHNRGDPGSSCRLRTSPGTVDFLSPATQALWSVFSQGADRVIAEWTASTRPDCKPIELRKGVLEGLAISFNVNVALTTAVKYVFGFTFTEET